MESTESEYVDSLYYSSVIWKIYNYFNGPLKEDTAIESPEFVTNLCEPIKWKLSIIGLRKLDEKCITEVLLTRLPSCSGPLVVNVKVRFVVVSNKDKMLYNAIHDAALAVNSIIRIRSFDIFQSIMDYNKTCFYDYENIRIRCDFLYDGDFTSNINADLKALSVDLKMLNMTGNHSNLSLKLGEDLFPVHRPIVKARSPYIARILNENPNLREIDLTRICSYSQLSGLITYWYSGDLDSIPRMESPYAFNFILNTEQFELRRYIDPETIVLSTTFDTISKRIRWDINDIQFIEKLKHLEKPVNYMYTCENYPWKLCFYPKGTTGDSQYFSLEIEDVRESGFLNLVYLEVFLVDRYGKEYGCKSTISGLHIPGQYLFPEFMTHESFVNYWEHLRDNNRLSFEGRIIFGTGRVKNRISSVCYSDIRAFANYNPYTYLAKDLKNLLESGSMSDISLKAGDRNFRVHKAILAARSVYLDCIVDNKKFETEVKILENFEPEDLYMVLKHLYYAEKIELHPELALKLHPVVRKLKITRLENLCTDYLQRQMPPGNAFLLT